jgi:hypothetical protein
MKEFRIQGWTLVSIWLTASAFIWLFSVVWPNINSWLKEQQHLSGWAQAVGVVVTVLAGFRMVRSQIRATQELESVKRQKELLLKTEIVYQLLGNALDAIDRAHDALFGRYLIDISGRTAALERGAEALEALPALEIPGPGVAIAVVQMPSRMRRLVANVSRTHEALGEARKARALYPNASPTDIPGRTKMYYQRAHNGARDACTSAMNVCKAQSTQLRALIGQSAALS